MSYKEYATAILALKAKDDALRERLIQEGTLWDGYHPKMRALHNENIQAFQALMDDYGFPGISKVGKEAYEAAFIIVQHAIDHPNILKAFAEDLYSAAKQGDATMLHVAYLVDRIAVFEGTPQVYGTQFDWDEAGQMSPIGVIDFDAVNVKRKALGILPMDAQIKKMRDHAEKTGQKPPKNNQEKQAAYLAWLKEVGWRT